MSETALSPIATPYPADAAPLRARTGMTARVAAVAKAMHRAILAALHAHARRQVALALGERVDALNEAIRNGAAARRALNEPKPLSRHRHAGRGATPRV
jgi:hypothetical protein